MSRLLVVLGNRNSKDETLSPTARLRCKAAADYIQISDTTHLLTTGAYGDNFNRSSCPHGKLLIEEIKNQMPADLEVIILNHTATAYTEEDIYCARRYFFYSRCEKITFISSNFHSERVREMAKLIFRDIQVDFVFAKDGEEITDADRVGEIARLKNFEKKWVDLPLYYEGVPFPDKIYDNAMDQHKHCDTISLAIATGALLFSSYPYTKIDLLDLDAGSPALLGMSGIIATCLLMLYARFAGFAYMARLVMRGLELGWGRSGFSYNYDRFYKSRWKYLGLFRTSRILVGVTIIMVIIDFGLALWKAAGFL